MRKKCVPEGMKHIKIEDATTSHRLIRACAIARIKYVGDTEQLTRREAHNLRGIGRKTFPHLVTLMKRFNLHFSNEPSAQAHPPLNRPSWDEYFLNIAIAVSARAIDPSIKVGTVIVDTGRRILATGYNGFPPNFPDQTLPRTRPEKYPYTVHSEANAIASNRSDLRLSTLYCTHSPCVECAKIIITAGIRRVVFRHIYATTPEAKAGYELSMRLFKMGKVDTMQLK